MAIDAAALNAQSREEFGKGAARRMRRDGRTPAVVYGHGQDPLHLSVDAHDLFLIIKENANALVRLSWDGETSLVIVKDLQRHPVTRKVEHVDFQRVSRNEKVEVEVPVIVEGEPAPGTIAAVEVLNVMISAPAVDIPENVVANVEGLEEGTRLTAADMQHPDDVEILVDPEEVLVSVMLPQVDTAIEEADAAMAEAQAEEAAEERAEEEE